jgi:hypothetical protein
MVRPIGGPEPKYNIRSSVSESFLLNSVGNDLWMSTYFLFVTQKETVDPFNYQLAMHGIQNFMNQFPASGSGPQGDSYLRGLWDDLTTTNMDHRTSLADLAADYTKNGFNKTDFNAFTAFVTDLASDALFGRFASNINSWGSKEGKFQANPQQLGKKAFDNLVEDFPLSSSTFSEFFTDIKAVSAELNASTPPLDGCCQFLSDLLNTPLDPTSSDTKLAAMTLNSLATSSDTTSLTAILKDNPSINDEIYQVLNKIKSMENW